ncbi:MAG TPA: hypothetical protein VF173_13490 [Thermoanaerobaculia bacterium]|nr:hypothetical protein [Thermoanaerobaculia bacterium]
MKTTVRVLGLTFALMLATLSHARGTSTGGCYVSCPYSEQTYHIYPTYGCCGPISPYDFTCPGGGEPYGFAYDDWTGPQFCV